MMNPLRESEVAEGCVDDVARGQKAEGVEKNDAVSEPSSSKVLTRKRTKSRSALTRYASCCAFPRIPIVDEIILNLNCGLKLVPLPSRLKLESSKPIPGIIVLELAVTLRIIDDDALNTFLPKKISTTMGTRTYLQQLCQDKVSAMADRSQRARRAKNAFDPSEDATTFFVLPTNNDINPAIFQKDKADKVDASYLVSHDFSTEIGKRICLALNYALKNAGVDAHEARIKTATGPWPDGLDRLKWWVGEVFTTPNGGMTHTNVYARDIIMDALLETKKFYINHLPPPDKAGILRLSPSYDLVFGEFKSHLCSKAFRSTSSPSAFLGSFWPGNAQRSFAQMFQDSDSQFSLDQIHKAIARGNYASWLASLFED